MPAEACASGARAEPEASPAPVRGPGSARAAAFSAVAVVLVAVALRIPTLHTPARSDEAGYLLVAGQSPVPGSEFLYGELWVDRPPLLLAFFRLAEANGGLVAVRSFALVAVVVLVLAAAHVGWTVGGLRASRWAAVTAAALQASPLLSAPGIDGELLALPWVLSSMAVGLAVLLARPSRPGPLRQSAGLVVAGALGSCAVLVKQNFVDALALLATLIVVLAVRRQLAAGTAARLLLALALGALLPVLLAVAWAEVRSTGVAGLWRDLVDFRSASVDVILSGSTGAVRGRAVRLLELGALTGLLPLLGLAALASLRHRRMPALTIAVAVTTSLGLGSIALGGSYWSHYLLQLLPAAVLGAAALAALRSSQRAVSRGLAVLAVTLVVTSSTIANAAGTPTTSCGSSDGRARAVSQWLRAHAQPGDTGLTLYGGPNTLYDSGVSPAYPYVWSLPVRVLDPDLQRLEAALTGPARATWAIQTLPLDSWRLDADGSLRRLLAAEYLERTTVCGRTVYLRRDRVR